MMFSSMFRDVHQNAHTFELFAKIATLHCTKSTSHWGGDPKTVGSNASCVRMTLPSTKPLHGNDSLVNCQM